MLIKQNHLYYIITLFVFIWLQFGESLTLYSQKDSLYDEEKSFQFLKACYLNDTAQISLFLHSDKVDFDFSSDDGATPAHYAVMNGNKQLLLALRSRNANLDKQDFEGVTPMLLAISQAKDSLILLLMQMGYSPLVQDYSKNDGIFYAVESQDTNTVKLILPYVQDINRLNLDGKTVLHVVAESNRPDLCFFILQAGAAIDTPDTYGYTPALSAYKNNALDAFDYLVHSGANPFYQKNHSENLMQMAIEKQDTFTLNQLVLPNIFKVKMNHRGELLRALSDDNISMVRLLENAGIMRPWHPVFDHSVLYIPFYFNKDDFLTGLAFRKRDCNRNFDFGGGFLLRPFSNKIFDEASPGVYYQYRESRYYLYLDQSIGFYALRNKTTAIKFMAGVHEGLSWGSWRGSDENPYSGFLAGWFAAISLRYNKIYYELRYSEMNFRSDPILRGKFSFSIGFLLN